MVNNIGKKKLDFCKRLGKSYKDLSIYLGIHTSEQNLWQKGREAYEILEWLEIRKRLNDLPEALVEIGRKDLENLALFILSSYDDKEDQGSRDQFSEPPPNTSEVRLCPTHGWEGLDERGNIWCIWCPEHGWYGFDWKRGSEWRWCPEHGFSEVSPAHHTWVKEKLGGN